jgi:hypothetical protein
MTPTSPLHKNFVVQADIQTGVSCFENLQRMRIGGQQSMNISRVAGKISQTFFMIMSS